MISDEQKLIITRLGVKPSIDVSQEIHLRTKFLVDYLMNSRHFGYIIGISGGIDSTVAGMLIKNAMEVLRIYHYPAKMIGVQLPYGAQIDENDAHSAMTIIQPDRKLKLNIKEVVDHMTTKVEDAWCFGDTRLSDFNVGNIKARQRMVAQYTIAGMTNGLVVGTDHASEAVMGFFTKFGDGAADVMPLGGLNKRQIRQIAEALGVPDHLINKVPTADLETNKPGLPDEVAFGLTYSQIDDFLEGKEVGKEAHDKIVNKFFATEHKRRLPVTPQQLDIHHETSCYKNWNIG